jgi:serine/threonine protein kinase
MSVGAEPVRWKRPRSGSEGTAQEWLDGLASGLCSADEFLSAMRDRFEEDRDGNWEVLSLLDQYYRRGKIELDLFRALKSRLEDSALGRKPNPAPLLPPRTSSTVTAPATGSLPATAPPPATAWPPVTVSLPATAPPQATAWSPATVSLPATAPPQVVATPPAAVSPQATVTPQEAPPGPRATIRALAIGDVLRGRYRIQAVLGHGGMGTVFEAIDEYRLDPLTAGQRLAIKVLHTAVTERKELLSELQREFQNLQLLSHPNVVRVHEFDRDGDLAFFTMELLSGSLLSRVLSARKAVALPRPYALAIMRDVGAALSHAHSRGVVHGDVNPQNIFITSDGELRVLDFGASHTLYRDIWDPDGDLQPHAPVATPGYASCQVLAGQRPDARYDLFAFACVCHVLLSGQHPFPKLTAPQARERRLRPARPAGLSGRQWSVLKEGLRWDRERRPADVQQWLTRFGIGGAAPRIPPLAMLVNAPPPRKPKTAPAAALLALVFAAAAGYWALTDNDSPTVKLNSLSAKLKDWGDQVSGLFTAEDASPGAGTESPRQPASETDQPGPVSRRSGSSSVNHNVAASTKSSLPPSAPPLPTAAARAAAAAPRVEAPAVNQGSAHVEMAADTVNVPATENIAAVTVQRRGNMHGEAAFKWWTESGTAKPATDFTPAFPRVEKIPNGRNGVILNIPVSNRPRSQARSFYVVIDQTESGATLGARTLTMVTLLPSD